MQQVSFKIQYDAFFWDDALEDLKGIEEFKNELSQEYITNVKGIGVGRGGAAYDFMIETLMNITLEDFLKFIGSGIAYDLIKEGAKSFLLKPFIDAFEKFNAKNSNAVRIGSWKFKFEDSDVIVNSVNSKGVYHIMPKIFNSLLKSYSSLNHPESKRGLKPDEIRIPVIYEPKMKESYMGNYRELTEMEDIEMDYDDLIYSEFWGLNFSVRQQQLVYSVKDSKVTGEEFCSADVYETYVLKDLNNEKL